MFNTPSGNPTSSNILPISNPTKEAYSEGFNITVFPATRAGPNAHMGISKG